MLVTYVSLLVSFHPPFITLFLLPYHGYLVNFLSSTLLPFLLRYVLPPIHSSFYNFLLSFGIFFHTPSSFAPSFFFTFLFASYLVLFSFAPLFPVHFYFLPFFFYVIPLLSLLYFFLFPLLPSVLFPSLPLPPLISPLYLLLHPSPLPSQSSPLQLSAL